MVTQSGYFAFEVIDYEEQTTDKILYAIMIVSMGTAMLCIV